MADEWRDPNGPGFMGIGEFTYRVKYGVFRPSEDHNLRGEFDYPEEAQEYIAKHPGYRLAVRQVPDTPEWEFLS